MIEIWAHESVTYVFGPDLMILVDEMGIRTHDLLIAQEEKSTIRHGATVT